jgi:uncharacterized membrane protein
MSDLIVIAYETEEKGFEALNALERLQRLQLIRLVDAAVAVKDQRGRVKVKQTLEHNNTGTAAGWGGFWGLLIGLLFGGPIVGGIIGALLGVLIGRSQDIGIDNNFIQEVGDSLNPGNSALCMLVLEADEEQVLPELQKLGGTVAHAVIQTSLSEESEKKLRQALEQDEVHAAAQDNLELG